MREGTPEGQNCRARTCLGHPYSHEPVWPFASGKNCRKCLSWLVCDWFGAEHDCSLFSEQTQESIQRFEQQAGLRDAGYTPHKGLTTEETKYLRVAEALHVSNQCCSWLEICLWFGSLQLSCLATKSDKIMGKGTRTALLRCIPSEGLHSCRYFACLSVKWCLQDTWIFREVSSY